jgi:hypothetical protein
MFLGRSRRLFGSTDRPTLLGRFKAGPVFAAQRPGPFALRRDYARTGTEERAVEPAREHASSMCERGCEGVGGMVAASRLQVKMCPVGRVAKESFLPDLELAGGKVKA